MTKFIFVTGGVVSSLGKGISAASLAALLEARGLKVTMIKMDPYINVDPGTMSPYQHGEVFVTDDGAETDLDLGYYERFLRRSRMSKKNNFTSGRIYLDVLTKEPPKEGNPLLELRTPNFILTPHVAWASDGAIALPLPRKKPSFLVKPNTYPE